MNTDTLMDCSQTGTSQLQRVNFFNRQLLTADDMTTDREYFLQKMRRHNRFLHGWGVVCGLAVTAAPTSSSPWRVQIGSGYALGPYGDEIFIGEAVYFDLAACISGGMTSPCEPGLVTSGGAGTSTTAYLAIEYAECLARPVQVASSGCGCADDPCQYSRVLDSFQIQCLAQLPQAPPAAPTLCEVLSGGQPATCPPCPTSPWVVLATITLPSASSMQITTTNIDNITNRQLILSTATLQEQIAACCCGQTQPGTVDLQSIMVRFPATINSLPGPWVTSLDLTGPTASFDYELVLTGDALTGGLSITVTSSSAGVTFSQTSPVVVPAGSSSQIVLSNSASLPPTGGEQTITLTATDPSGNTATATLVISAPNTSVALEAINVRPDLVGVVAKWEGSANFNGSQGTFDYEVILTGNAPAPGLPITVTASQSGVTFSPSFPATVTVPANSSSQVALGISMSIPVTTATTPITLTATDPSNNSATATLTFGPATVFTVQQSVTYGMTTNEVRGPVWTATFTLSVTNNGTVTSNDAVLTVNLAPASVANEFSMLLGLGWQSASTFGQLTSNPFTVPAGGAATPLTFTITAHAQNATGTITSTGSVLDSTLDASATANSVTALVGQTGTAG